MRAPALVPAPDVCRVGLVAGQDLRSSRLIGCRAPARPSRRDVGCGRQGPAGAPWGALATLPGSAAGERASLPKPRTAVRHEAGTNKLEGFLVTAHLVLLCVHEVK